MSSSYTIYCSKACQHSDWSTHKISCGKAKQRARLFQAGALLKALILTFGEKANYFAIHKLEVTAGSRLDIFDGRKNESSAGDDLTRFAVLLDQQYQALVSFASAPLMVKAMHWLVSNTLAGMWHHSDIC